jgi:hypothetical protein
MILSIPKFSSAKTAKAVTNFSPLIPSPTNQQLADSIKQLQTLINALESRVGKLETAVTVEDDGSVLIHARNLTLYADRLLQLTGDQTEVRGNSMLNLMAFGTFSLQSNMMEVSTGQVALSTGMLRVAGTVKCDTIIANSVVGSSYTPGAGNIW